MNNILIITKDMKYFKKLMNSIHKELKNVVVWCFASNNKEISYSLLNYNIDLVLVDLPYNNYLKLETKKIISKRKLKKSIILISDTEVNEVEILSSPYLYDYVIKNNNLSQLLQKTRTLAYTKKSLYKSEKDKAKEAIIKEKIKNELLYLGYKISHDGTKYLIDTIYLLYTLKDYYDNNLEKDIYPIVGKKYGKSVNSIRGSIVFATDAMTYECEEQKLMDYLYMKQYIKPGGKTIAEAVLGKINN